MYLIFISVIIFRCEFVSDKPIWPVYNLEHPDLNAYVACGTRRFLEYTTPHNSRQKSR